MARGATIGIKGLAELKKKLGSLPKAIAEEADAELYAAAIDFEGRAAEAAPKDQGMLAQGISAARIGEMEYEVVSSSPYSAYMEWGTRSRVQVPSDLQQYASQFRGKGNQGDAKQAIFDWCKRVGIPEELWQLIFFKIMTEGVKPQPFFFIQREPVMQELQKNLGPAIKKALSK